MDDDQTPIIVYRIEHPETGWGPFWNGCNGEHVEALGKMPTPYNDPGIAYCFRSGIDYLAFSSLEMLKHWVSQYWTAFLADGMVLRAYLTDEYMIGKHQVAFVQCAAVLLATFTEIPEEEVTI